MIEGVCHDALRLCHEGDAKKAFDILKHKIIEIERYERVDYANVIWKVKKSPRKKSIKELKEEYD